MHILAASSSLRAIRAIRYRDVGIWLPEPADTRISASLESPSRLRTATSRRTATKKPTTPALAYSHLADSTLADLGIDFGTAIVNKRIETFRLGDLGPFNREDPLELAVFASDRKTVRKTVRANILRTDLPASALIRVDPSLWITCPELTVMLLAKQLSPIELAQVIMELCGSHSLHPDPTARHEPPRYNVSPVMSLEGLAAFAQTARVRGDKATLRTAYQLACEHSASPMETNVTLLLSASPALGGYGFPKPALNAPLMPPDEDLPHLSQQSYALDLFWQDCLADIECEGTEHHLDPLTANASGDAISAWRSGHILKEESDRRRLRELQYLGIQVIPVTSYDLRSEYRTRSVARALAKRFQTCGVTDVSDVIARIDNPAAAATRAALLEKLSLVPAVPS